MQRKRNAPYRVGNAWKGWMAAESRAAAAVAVFHGPLALMRGHRRCRLLPPCLLLLLVLVCLPAALLFITLAQHPSAAAAAARHRSLHHQEQQRNSSGSSSGWGGGGGEAFRRRMAARMTSRRQHLHDACTRLGLHLPSNDSLHRPNPWEFLINRNYHLIWCNVFKAASTSWMYNFNILAGYKPQFLKRSMVVPLQLARRRYPRPTLPQLRAALNDSLAFLVARHPFERLLSAYRDKIQSALPNTPHQKLGQQIVNNYRFNQPDNKEKKSAKSKVSYNPRWPTFYEFVRYLIDVQRRGDQLDMHWTPITEFCTPCQIDFDIIAKFETLHEDQRYLIDLAGVGNIIKPEWKNPSKGRVTKEVIATYFSQLTVRQMLQLYNIYRFDFELFDYSLDNYIRMAKLEPSSPTSLP